MRHELRLQGLPCARGPGPGVLAPQPSAGGAGRAPRGGPAAAGNSRGRGPLPNTCRQPPLGVEEGRLVPACRGLAWFQHRVSLSPRTSGHPRPQTTPLRAGEGLKGTPNPQGSLHPRAGRAQPAGVPHHLRPLCLVVTLTREKRQMECRQIVAFAPRVFARASRDPGESAAPIQGAQDPRPLAAIRLPLRFQHPQHSVQRRPGLGRKARRAEGRTPEGPISTPALPCSSYRGS